MCFFCFPLLFAPALLSAPLVVKPRCVRVYTHCARLFFFLPFSLLRPPWSADIHGTLGGWKPNLYKAAQLRPCRDTTMKGQSLDCLYPGLCVRARVCVWDCIRRVESVGTTVNLQIKFGQVGSKCVSLIGLLHMKQMAMILMRRQQRECVCTHVCVCVRVSERERERQS